MAAWRLCLVACGLHRRRHHPLHHGNPGKYILVHVVASRDDAGDVHAVASPASASPTHVGVISSPGTASDYAMAFDHALRVLYLFESETDTAGRVWALE